MSPLIRERAESLLKVVDQLANISPTAVLDDPGEFGRLQGAAIIAAIGLRVGIEVYGEEAATC